MLCNYFTSFKFGGRGKKTAKKRGRHSDDHADMIKSIKEAQPLSFYPPGLTPQYSIVHSSLRCCIGLEVLNRPVLLPAMNWFVGPAVASG